MGNIIYILQKNPCNPFIKLYDFRTLQFQPYTVCIQYIFAHRNKYYHHGFGGLFHLALQYSTAYQMSEYLVLQKAWIIFTAIRKLEYKADMFTTEKK